MNQAIINRRNLTFLSIAFIVMGFSPKSFEKVKNESSIEVKFLSKVEMMPVFELNINNNEAGTFSVRVKDGFENVLFKETISGKRVARKYLLEVEASDFHHSDFKLVFEVTNLKTNKTSVYKVTRNERLVEDISIAKL